MLQITTADAKRALERANAAQSRLKNLREKGEELTESVVRTVEVLGSAFTFGVVQGAGVFKGGEIFGVPVELFGGLTLHGLRFLGMGGRHSAHLSNFGDGALAGYVHVLGRGVGQTHWGAKTAGEMSGDLADRLAQIAAAA